MAVKGILDSFEARLDAIQERATSVKGVRSILRKVEALRAEELPDGLKLTLPSDKQVEQLREWATPAGDDAEVKELVEKVEATLVLGADEIGAAEAERAEQLLDRYSSLGGKRRAGPASGLRALPFNIGFTHVCGKTRQSPSGDWGSIRHQANQHAKECEQGGEVAAQDLNKARDALSKGESVEVSGFQFFAEKSD